MKPLRAACAILLLGSAVSAADVIYTTFGPGDTYDTSSGWSIGGVGVMSQGLQFTPASGGTVQTIEIAAFQVAGGTDLNVSLMTDAAGQPDSVLETVQIGPFAAIPSIQSASSVIKPLLNSGTKYWLVVSPINASDDFGWNRNVTLPPAPNAQRSGTAPWVLFSDFQGAMRITGATPTGVAVPTLSTWGMVMLALLLAALSAYMLRSAAT
jgi:exosortase sorting signal-containing protein